MPAVVGEILAGILIGPSVLGLVGQGDEVLRTLGELGVILLLLEVGWRWTSASSARSARRRCLVATVGVVAPMVLGFGAMELIGDDFNTALFVGAALTATSVGHHGPRLRRPPGAGHHRGPHRARRGGGRRRDGPRRPHRRRAARDRGLGVGRSSVAGIVVVAVAFLVVGGVVGLRVAPPLFALRRALLPLGGHARRPRARLHPGVRRARRRRQAGADRRRVRRRPRAQPGASRRERIRRELAPVGHLLHPGLLPRRSASTPTSSAFVRGRRAARRRRSSSPSPSSASSSRRSAPSARRATSSSSGSGMLPRGEVGLIFATIGLQNGVLGDDLYAALLLVVLVTTLVTPPLLKFRYRRSAPTALPTVPTGHPATRRRLARRGRRRGRPGRRPSAGPRPGRRPRRAWRSSPGGAGRPSGCSTGSRRFPMTPSCGTTTGAKLSSTSSSGATLARGACSSLLASSLVPCRRWSRPSAIERPIRCLWTPQRPIDCHRSSECARWTSTTRWLSSSASWTTSTPS